MILATLNLGEAVIWLAIGGALALGFRKVIIRWMTGDWK